MLGGQNAFWSQFGKVIKEGLYEDLENRDKIIEIIRVFSNKQNDNITIQEYLENMAEGQDSIYYLMTRGISRKNAIQMLTKAFMLEITESILNIDIRKFVEKRR